MKPLAILFCLGLLAAACDGETAAQPKDAAAPHRKAPETLEVKSTRVPRTLSYVGTVVAPRDALVASPRGGRVEAYFFEVGQPVKRNDVLVKLAAAELDFASQAAAASVKSARARITTSAGLVRAWVVENDRLRERPLSVLRVEGEQLLVSSGLKSGEKIVRVPFAGLPERRGRCTVKPFLALVLWLLASHAHAQPLAPTIPRSTQRARSSVPPTHRTAVASGAWSRTSNSQRATRA
jgi:multidrug efflux pump subunit AcrA (membrane-fusion protein)